MWNVNFPRRLVGHHGSCLIEAFGFLLGDIYMKRILVLLLLGFLANVATSQVPKPSDDPIHFPRLFRQSQMPEGRNATSHSQGTRLEWNSKYDVVIMRPSFANGFIDELKVMNPNIRVLASLGYFCKYESGIWNCDSDYVLRYADGSKVKIQNNPEAYAPDMFWNKGGVLGNAYFASWMIANMDLVSNDWDGFGSDDLSVSGIVQGDVTVDINQVDYDRNGYPDVDNDNDGDTYSDGFEIEAYADGGTAGVSKFTTTGSFVSQGYVDYSGNNLVAHITVYGFYNWKTNGRWTIDGTKTHTANTLYVIDAGDVIIDDPYNGVDQQCYADDSDNGATPTSDGGEDWNPVKNQTAAWASWLEETRTAYVAATSNEPLEYWNPGSPIDQARSDGGAILMEAEDQIFGGSLAALYKHAHYWVNNDWADEDSKWFCITTETWKQAYDTPFHPEWRHDKRAQSNLKLLRAMLATCCVAGAFYDPDYNYFHEGGIWLDELETDLGYYTTKPYVIDKGFGAHWYAGVDPTPDVPTGTGASGGDFVVRFFDNGVVIVYMGSEVGVDSAKLTDQDLQDAWTAVGGGGPYPGPYYSFLGGQDPEWNNGREFTSRVFHGYFGSNRDGNSRQNNSAISYGDGLILYTTRKIVVSSIVVGNDDIQETSPMSPGPLYTGSWTNKADIQDNDDNWDDNPYWTQGPVYNTEVNGVWYYGYKTAEPTSHSSVVYSPSIGVSGYYGVYEWHGWEGEYESTSNEATNAPYKVFTGPKKGPLTLVLSGTIDDRNATKQGQWNYLGMIHADAGDQVNIVLYSYGADETVIADAFKLEYSGQFRPTAAGGGYAPAYTGTGSRKIAVLTSDYMDSSGIPWLHLTTGGMVLILGSYIDQTDLMTIEYKLDWDDGGQQTTGWMDLFGTSWFTASDGRPSFYNTGNAVDETRIGIERLDDDSAITRSEFYILGFDPKWGLWEAGIKNKYAWCPGYYAGEAGSCDSLTKFGEYWVSSTSEALAPFRWWADSDTDWINPGNVVGDGINEYFVSFKISEPNGETGVATMRVFK